MSRPTTEPNGTATFTIVLDIEPTADVTMALRSSDTTEGTVSPASVVFTAGNWNVPRRVTVTGVDDDHVDGDVVYAILIDPAVTTDGRYRGLDAADVTLRNLDNDPLLLPGGAREFEDALSEIVPDIASAWSWATAKQGRERSQ